MKKEYLKRKLSERSPLSTARSAITPVNLYDVSIEDNQSQKDKVDEKSHNRTFAQSHQNTIVRINRGYKFREGIIKDMKNLATNSNKKLYEVMEEAMLDYLKDHSS
jgi:hypothetical protein